MRFRFCGSAVFLTACLLGPLLVPAPAAADQVQLKNGDVYTGSLVTLVAGVLKFNAGVGSTIDVPWSDVVWAAIDGPVVVLASGQPRQTAGSLMVIAGEVRLPTGVTLSATDLTSLTRPAGPATLTGGANAGFVSSSGSTHANSLRLDAEGVVRARENRYTLSGQLNRTAEGDVETAHNATGTARYDRFVSPRLYTNANVMFTGDQFRDLDLRTAVGVGLGYQVADNARLRLGIEAGYGYVNRRFKVAPDDSYHAGRETASLDVFVIGKRLTVFHRHDGFFGLKGNDQLFVQTRNGVRIGLVGGLITTLEWDIDYDISRSPAGQQTNRVFTMTFGYRF